MQVIAGPTGVKSAKELAERLDCEILIPEFKIFPDGESYLRYPEKPAEEIIIIQSCFYPQDSNLFQLLNLVKTARTLGSESITVFVPYLCYARADRAVKEGEAVSIHTVLDLLEAVGVDHLITLDLHNPDVLDYTSMETTNIFASISMKNYLDKYLDDTSHLQVIAPDEGAIERAEHLASILEIPATSLQKYRNPDTGKVSLQLGSAEIRSDEIIIVDDIISTGGTLVEASNLLIINGVSKIHYLITHAMGTDAVDKLQEIGNGLVAASDSTNTMIGKFSAIEDLLQVLQS